MADVRGDEWLPKGWKVETRVRKSGRKDRYYTDPTSGYVFRSLKDIDRYLLTGKFGRHAKKSKNNDDAGSDPTLDADEAAAGKEDASKEKGSKKGVEKQNLCKKGKKKPNSGGTNSSQKLKNRKISKSPHRKGSDDFFILDSDQGTDISNELGLPNIPEIIDSVRKSEDNRNATYLSAPEIAVLLGRQAAHENALSRDQNLCMPIKTDMALDSPLNLSWGEICSDPCIEFAIKTLTGAIPLERVRDYQKGMNIATNEECTDLVQGNNI